MDRKIIANYDKLLEDVNCPKRLYWINHGLIDLYVSFTNIEFDRFQKLCPKYPFKPVKGSDI